ncbi:MAG: hypothetical protein K9N51_09975 [Candidatus Pacebacteria bacterium]|nr:hypothetical protein [Candidatus Paceibacterota bacterium]
MREKTAEIIWEAVAELNEMRPPDDQITKSEDTVITGRNSLLDSLAIVNLVAIVEQKMTSTLDVSLELADQLGDDNGALQTFGTLIDYATQRVCGE